MKISKQIDFDACCYVDWKTTVTVCVCVSVCVGIVYFFLYLNIHKSVPCHLRATLYEYNTMRADHFVRSSHQNEQATLAVYRLAGRKSHFAIEGQTLCSFQSCQSIVYTYIYSALESHRLLFSSSAKRVATATRQRRWRGLNGCQCHPADSVIYQASEPASSFDGGNPVLKGKLSL
jgi:hypothetical protein